VRTEKQYPASCGLSLFAKLVVAATFVLIIAGGNVTSKGAGLAVPDWPTSFGSFNPNGWTRMPQVREEHSHRLIGAGVGLLVIGLTIWLWKVESRAWVRKLGYFALLAVIIQGVMGGLRVTELSLSLAIIHGCFAQAFFCMVIALATVTSPRWSPAEAKALSPAEAKAFSPEGAKVVSQGRKPLDGFAAQNEPSPGGATESNDHSLRLWTIALAAAVYAQLILGAIVRHTGSGGMAISHIFGALAIAVCLMQAAGYVFGGPHADRLAPPMIALFLLFGLQIILGVMTYLLVMGMELRTPGTLLQTYLPTAHVAIGAIILGTSFYLALRAYAMTGGIHPAAKTVEFREALA